MHVKPDTGARAYASASLGRVVSRAKETHAPNRVIRMRNEWDEVAEVVGPRKRADLFLQFARWYLHYPGAAIPKRPVQEVAERARREVAERIAREAAARAQAE
jgi:hypothetical protein